MTNILNEINDRVVDFELSDDKRQVRIEEMCDMYFSADLTKAQFQTFIDQLQALHNTMDG